MSGDTLLLLVCLGFFGGFLLWPSGWVVKHELSLWPGNLQIEHLGDARFFLFSVGFRSITGGLVDGEDSLGGGGKEEESFCTTDDGEGSPDALHEADESAPERETQLVE